MLLIPNLTFLNILILSITGVAVLRIWLHGRIMEDMREQLKLLDESRLLGLGEKVAELSQCPHCLSVHIGWLLAMLQMVYVVATKYSLLQLVNQLGYLPTLPLLLAASEIAIVGLAISLCIELLYKATQLVLMALDDMIDSFDQVANFQETEQDE